MYEKIVFIIKKYVQLPDIEIEEVANMNLQNYGLDSLKTISLILNLEAEFDFEFPDELLRFENLTTPEEIYQALQKIARTPTQ